ncbi:citrate (Si)-synthase, partial [Coemansia sp. RSA 485]
MFALRATSNASARSGALFRLSRVLCPGSNPATRRLIAAVSRAAKQEPPPKTRSVPEQHGYLTLLCNSGAPCGSAPAVGKPAPRKRGGRGTAAGHKQKSPVAHTISQSDGTHSGKRRAACYFVTWQLSCGPCQKLVRAGPVLARQHSDSAFGLASNIIPALAALARFKSTSSAASLKQRVQELIPEKNAEVKEVKQKYGDRVLGETTVNMAYGGMRGIKGMVWDTSLLD